MGCEPLRSHMTAGRFIHREITGIVPMSREPLSDTDGCNLHLGGHQAWKAVPSEQKQALR